MRKKSTHKKYPCANVLALVVAFHVACMAFAQKQQTDSSVISTMDDRETKQPSVFDSVGLVDTASYHPYLIEDTVISRLKKDDAFWYASDAVSAKRNYKSGVDKKWVQKNPFYLQNWFRNLVWIMLIVFFVAVVIWFLLSSDVKLFRRKPQTLTGMLDQDLTRDIFSIDYESELQQALKAGQYSLGVRLMYLHILRSMAERDLIIYKMESTNSTYLRQLQDHPFYKDFLHLTRIFEFVCYGKVHVNEERFLQIKKDYTTFKNRLHS